MCPINPEFPKANQLSIYKYLAVVPASKAWDYGRRNTYLYWMIHHNRPWVSNRQILRLFLWYFTLTLAGRSLPLALILLQVCRSHLRIQTIFLELRYCSLHLTTSRWYWSHTRKNGEKKMLKWISTSFGISSMQGKKTEEFWICRYHHSFIENWFSESGNE